MNIVELEKLYKMSLQPIFKNQFRIIHDYDDCVNIIIELVSQLKDSIFLSKEEIVKGKIPSGYDDIKEYVVQAKANNFLKNTYQLANILIKYV